MTLLRTLTAVFSLLLLSLPVAAQDKISAPADQAVAKATKPYHVVTAYPLGTCIVSGEELDDEAVSFEVDGRAFKTCCKKCKAKIEKDVATYATKLDAALASAQVASYPLDVCVISGKKLGSMGDPIQHLFEDVLVQLCCKGCNKKAIAAAPALAERVRDAAYAAQAANYPLATCVASGEKLGADTYDVMFGNRLVRFCCEDCVDEFKANPSAMLAQLDAAAMKGKKTEKVDGESKGHEGHGKGKDVDKGVSLTSSDAKSAGCGDACVEGATGGCCGGGAKPAAKPAEGGCCEGGAGKVVAPKVEIPAAEKKID